MSSCHCLSNRIQEILGLMESQMEHYGDKIVSMDDNVRLVYIRWVLAEEYPAWISNYIHYNVWCEITYTFPNFNSATVEVCEWISNFIPHFTRYVITHPCWD